MPFASVADRIIFVTDVIGKEFVSVGDEISLKCCVADTVNSVQFQVRTCYHFLHPICLPSGSADGPKYQHIAEWYFFFLLFTAANIYHLMVVTEQKRIGNNDADKRS